MSKTGITLCFLCKHFDVEAFEESIYIRRCDAFPDRIPTEIQGGKIDHRLAYEGDNGIRFEFQDDTSKLPQPMTNISVEDARKLLNFSIMYADFTHKPYDPNEPDRD